MCHILWKVTIIHGKTHYLNDHFQCRNLWVIAKGCRPGGQGSSAQAFSGGRGWVPLEQLTYRNQVNLADLFGESRICTWTNWHELDTTICKLEILSTQCWFFRGWEWFWLSSWWWMMTAQDTKNTNLQWKKRIGQNSRPRGQQMAADSDHICWFLYWPFNFLGCPIFWPIPRMIPNNQWPFSTTAALGIWWKVAQRRAVRVSVGRSLLCSMVMVLKFFTKMGSQTIRSAFQVFLKFHRWKMDEHAGKLPEHIDPLTILTSWDS